MSSVSAALSVIVLLPVLALAQRNCRWAGAQYTYLEIFNDTNGCTKLQCQANGRVEVIHKACRNGSICYKVDERFIVPFTDQHHICTRNSALEYVINEVAAPSTDCGRNGKTYKNLDFLQQTDDCKTYQCQNREWVLLSPDACRIGADGFCHFVGEWFQSNNKVYQCRRTDVNGTASYSYPLLDPQPDLTPTCTRNYVTVNSLETWLTSDLCESYQCQSGNLVQLNEVCRYAEEDRKCYGVNQQWYSSGELVQCIKDPSRGYRIMKASITYKNCTVGSATYRHLELFLGGNGCETKQCVGGVVKNVEGGCKHTNTTCYPPKIVFLENGKTYQCNNPNGVWTIVEIPTENGSSAGSVIPQ